MADQPRELPRDINAGAMAALLFKSGAFGSEIDFCAALAWDGEIEHLRFEDETSCCEELLRRYNAGSLVSDYQYCSKRVKGEESADEAAKTMLAEAYAQLEETFAPQVKAHQALTPALREEAFATYLNALPADVRSHVNGLLGIALQNKWVSREFAAAWHQDEPALSGKQFAGFAYKSGDAIKVYANAYLPDVWKRWLKTPDASAIYVGAVKGNAPIPQLRKTFEGQLTALFDDAYFALLQG